MSKAYFIDKKELAIICNSIKVYIDEYTSVDSKEDIASAEELLADLEDELRHYDKPLKII